MPFYKVDIRDWEGLSRVFALHNFDCCIHFAGLKAVGESVEMPITEACPMFGDDYATPDGTGWGYSVLEVVHAFEKVSGITIPYVM